MDDLAFLKEFNAEPEAVEGDQAAQKVEEKAATLQEQAPAPTGDNVKLDTRSEEKVEDRKKQAKKRNKPLIEPHKVPDLPVPNGPIGLLILLALFLIFAVTPVGKNRNDSRLTLLWKAITGQVHIVTPGGAASENGAPAPGSAAAVGGSYTNPGDDPTAPPAIGGASNAWGSQWGGGFY